MTCILLHDLALAPNKGKPKAPVSMGLIPLRAGGCLIGATRILTVENEISRLQLHRRVLSKVDLQNVAYQAPGVYRDESNRETNRTYEDVERKRILSSSFPSAMHTREI
jgi:hypothetical protein